MAKAKITPNGIWPEARFGEVEESQQGHGKKTTNVPIVVIPICPADPEITQQEFPRGVVILNDHPIPFNAATIELDEWRTGDSTTQPHIDRNVIWPNGVVVLWD